MNYSSTHTIASTVCPGVSFTLKKATRARRQAVDDLRAPFYDRLKPLQDELEPLDAAYRAAYTAARLVGKDEREALIADGAMAKEALEKFPYGPIDLPDDQFRRWADLSAQISKLDHQEITPLVLLYMVTKIEGIEFEELPMIPIPGREENPPTRAGILLGIIREGGPDELYDEIVKAVRRGLGLDGEEKENLSSPSTSATAVDGKVIPGDVAPAETRETTSSGDAASSTDPANASVPSTPNQP